LKIEFTVLGNPTALKRHRTFRRGNFTGQYDPSKADKRAFAAVAQSNAPEQPIDCPLSMCLGLYFERPKSHYNKKGLKPTSPKFHTSRPDADNILKFVCDALDGIYFKDDSRVCNVVIYKLYDEKPRTEVTIETLI